MRSKRGTLDSWLPALSLIECRARFSGKEDRRHDTRQFEASQTEEMLMALAIHKPALGKAATAFLGRQHRMLIGGKWVEARSAKPFRSRISSRS
jgi:hypothetical protein